MVKLPRWVASWHGCRPIRGWDDCFWRVRSTVCFVKRRLPLRCFLSAIHFAQQTTLGAGRASMARCEVDRMLWTVCWRLKAFYAGGVSHDPTLELHPGGARNVLRSADQLFRVAEFTRAARADRPDLALMQALVEAFPDRLAKLRGGNAGSGAHGRRTRRAN